MMSLTQLEAELDKYRRLFEAMNKHRSSFYDESCVGTKIQRSERVMLDQGLEDEPLWIRVKLL